jgi:hypothetical protein
MSDNADETEPTLVIDERTSQRVPADWSEAIMRSAGAGYIAEVRDEAGNLIGYNIDPPLTQSAYDAVAGEVLRALLLDHSASARWRKETGGINLAGQPIATDRESQGLISGAFALVQQQPETTIRFKTPSGFVTLDAAQMTVIAIAVAQHVQACFAIEADIAGDIASGEITTTAEIDAAFAG